MNTSQKQKFITIVKQKKHLTNRKTLASCKKNDCETEKTSHKQKNTSQMKKLKKKIVKQKKHLTLCLLPPKPRASPLLIVSKIVAKC